MSTSKIINIKIPEVYKGIVKAKQGITKGNIEQIWVECSDGKFRSPHSHLVISYENIKSDEKNGYLIRLA